MQLLTASKLSTVAMLAMAAVLHFSVSAVPMEQADAVEEVAPVVEEVVPAAKAPIDLSAYASPVPGQPSQKAIEDMIAVYNWLRPPSPQENAPLSSVEVPKPASRASRKADKKAITGKSLKHLKELAETSQYNFNLVEGRLPQLTHDLITNLDKAWERLERKLSSERVGEQGRAHWTAGSSAWAKTLKSTFGLKKLEECPYHLISGFKLGKLLNLKLGLEKLPPPKDKRFLPKPMTNICRLAVNGGYYWLMRILTMKGPYTLNGILSVLGSLRLFSSDEALVRDLDNVLSLLALVAKANSMQVPACHGQSLLLMLAVPNVIDALEVSRQESKKAALFLLASQQYRKDPSLGDNLAYDVKMLLEHAEIGNMDAIAFNLYQHSDEQYLFREYLRKLINNILSTDKYFWGTKGALVNSLLDYSPRELQMETQNELPAIHHVWYDYLNIMELLVNVLDLDQFINLYGRMANEHKGLALIVIAGRSRKGPDAMFHVFSDILGEQRMPIKDGIQVDGQPLNAGHLAQLVRGCAMVCTEDNWKLFVEELLDRLKVTEHLPSDPYWEVNKVETNKQLPGSSDKVDQPPLSPAGKVAYEITGQIVVLNGNFQRSGFLNTTIKQSAEEAIEEAITRMNWAIKELNTIHDSKIDVKKAL